MFEESVANALSVEGGPQEEETTAPTTGENAGEGEEQNQANEQTEEQKRHKRLGGWQRKIQRLEQENEMLRDIALRARETPAPKTETRAQADDGSKPAKPRLDDFDSYDKFEAAKDDYFEKVADWKLEQREKAAAAKVEAGKQQDQQKTIAQKWEAKQKSGRAAHDDFEETVSNPDLQINAAMRDVILESEVGDELAYYLGKNETEASRIAHMNPILAARELGKIEARLAKEQSTAEDTKPPVSKAPVPPKPTRRSSPTDNGDLRDDLPADEWAKRFRARLEKASR